ncbi:MULTISPECIES: hypothetical protein [Pantoea]|uniref:hypothetical protein n=1 Tax=Pantoea TaxID=53335 RepID=UPI002B1D736C|nr:hypothetical protein [Pantoea ananatis]
MEFFEEISTLLSNIPDWLSALITAFIGAIVGGRYTLKGVNRAAKIAAIQARQASNDLQLSVLKGIKGEISILLSVYDKRMRVHIDAIGPRNMMQIGFPVGDDNFTFYEQNAREIAKLNDESRESIISIYTYARSLIQSFKGNNQLIVDLESLTLTLASRPEDDFCKRLYEAKVEVMIDYAQGLKLIDGEVRKAIEDGFIHIDKEIERLERLNGKVID